MDPRNRPYRSALYIPASKERALDKARGLACDAIIFDLEDAVTPEEKPAAMETARESFGSTGSIPLGARMMPRRWRRWGWTRFCCPRLKAPIT